MPIAGVYDWTAAVRLQALVLSRAIVQVFNQAVAKLLQGRKKLNHSRRQISHLRNGERISDLKKNETMLESVEIRFESINSGT